MRLSQDRPPLYSYTYITISVSVSEIDVKKVYKDRVVKGHRCTMLCDVVYISHTHKMPFPDSLYFRFLAETAPEMIGTFILTLSQLACVRTDKITMEGILTVSFVPFASVIYYLEKLVVAFT